MNKTLSRLLLLVEFILAGAFGWLILKLSTAWIEDDMMLHAEDLIKLWSKALILLLTLLINVMFRIRHRARNPEGELLPLMFLFMTLCCSTLLPDYYRVTGRLLMDPIWINVLIRFSMLFCSALFVFKSLTFVGSTTGQTGHNVALAFVLTFILSMSAPNDSLITSAARNFGSVYDSYFFLGIQIMNLASIVTFTVASVMDKTGHNIKRSITYSLIMIGHFGILLYSNLITLIVMDILFLAGSIMLLTRTKKSYW